MKLYFGLTVDNSRTSNQSTDKKEEPADDDGRSPTTANKMFMPAWGSV